MSPTKTIRSKFLRRQHILSHKLVINENRLPEYKQEKDAAAVRRIFHMADSSSFRKELLHIYGRLFPKQRKKFLGACERYGLRQIRDAAQGMGR